MKFLKRLVATVVCSGLILGGTLLGVREFAVRELRIDGAISRGFDQVFMPQLKFFKNYHIIIESQGGMVDPGMAVINKIYQMKAEGCKFTTESYGRIMSMGVFLFMMGDERIIHDGAAVMLHYAGMYNSYGRAKWKDLNAEQRKLLEICNMKFERMFKEISGMTDDDIKIWVERDENNFIHAADAYRLGIATKYIKDGVEVKLVPYSEER